MTVIDDNVLITDHEFLWAALNAFYEEFTTLDWRRKHGKEWTFVDVPYHLSIFNQLTADAIQMGENNPQLNALTTLHQLEAWNNTNCAMRSPKLTPRNICDQMIRSQNSLRQSIVALRSLDSPVWLPILAVRGWRTARFAVEYSYWHTWMHYTESCLRKTGTLPELTEQQIQRGLDFYMEIIAAGVDSRRALTPFVWQLELTGKGGGQWTFQIHDGHCAVNQGLSTIPDIKLVADVAAYLKTAAFGIQNSLLAMLTGKLRVTGIGKLRRLQKLFAPDPQQIWQPIPRGTLPSPD